MQNSAHFPTVPNRPASQPSVPLTVWLVRLLIASGFMTAVTAAVVLMVLASYGLSYRGVVYPGVSAWGQDLSGMTPSEAAAALSAAFNYPSTPAFIMRDNGGPNPRAWSATPAQLGVTFDLPASVNAAYEVGRTGNVLVDADQVFRSWYGGVQVSPVVKYDEQQILVFLNNVAREVFLPVAEATLSASGTTVTTTPGQIGRQLDVLATAAQLRDPLQRLGAADVPLIFIETPPLVLDASAQAAQARALLREPLTLSVENPAEGDPAPLVIDQAALGAMLQVRRVDDGPNAAHYEVGLDPVALRVHLDPLTGSLSQAPENARFIFNDDTQQLELLQPSRSTRQLNIDATIARIKEALAQDVHSVPLVLDVIAPAAPDTATAAELGVTQLVSEQSTYFAGSSAERVRNIEVAAARFHGLLVAPGATFSFNEHLGDVSLDSGFAEALIIFGGRTIRGVGGGVCQVSTTIFRAAYFGGYPIEERYSHAYRVSYYEKGDAWKGPGLDATVYSPLVDFKFKNDTPSWLLMEVYVTPAASRITWKFYSTSDGRQVTVGQADVQNVIPAPEPLYEEDASLAAGVIKQTDYAADGADVAVYRTITRDGAQVNTGEPPLTTHYQPWRAVFSYGPGTVIPAPSP